MIDYTNAPPSHSALFDNVPTVQPARKTSADYVDGVTAIWPSGRTQQGRCKRAALLSAEDARTALEHGAVCVFVRREDVAAVLGAANG